MPESIDLPAGEILPAFPDDDLPSLDEGEVLPWWLGADYMSTETLNRYLKVRDRLKRDRLKVTPRV